MISVLVSPAEENNELFIAFDRSGAKAIMWPGVKITPPANHSALDDAIENLFGYDWLILRNANAARFFLSRIREINHRLDELDQLRLCVIGDEASELVRESQIHIDVEIERRDSNRTFTAIESYVGDSAYVSALNILVPSANVTRDLSHNQFDEAGARVDSLTAYRTTSDPQALAQLNALLVGGGIDRLFFRNAAEVSEFAQLFDTNELSRILRETSVICGDQPTQTAAAEFQLTQTIVPGELEPAAITKLVVRLRNQAAS